MAELGTLFLSQGQLWNSLSSGIVNSNAPAAEITYFIPDSLSGTRVFFEDEVGVTIPLAGFNDDEPIIDGELNVIIWDGMQG